MLISIFIFIEKNKDRNDDNEDGKNMPCFIVEPTFDEHCVV